jgi:hypothetical protein
MTGSIHPQSAMKRVLEVFPGAQRALFRRHHVGGCASCAFQPDETLEALCARNNLNVAEVIQQIETALHSALQPQSALAAAPAAAPGLLENITQAGAPAGKLKIILLDEDKNGS